MGRDPNTTVSYYTKGPVVGFLLDAHIRRLTDGEGSLGDVMRRAYQRYAGERGFTPAEFRAVAEEVAGRDLSAWFEHALSSTEELDYTEALDWFGLQFAPTTPDNADAWRLEIRPDATETQVAHLRALFEPERRVAAR